MTKEEWFLVDSVRAKRWMAATGAAATGVAALAIAFSTTSQADPEPLPPGPVTAPEMSTAETTTDVSAPAKPETPVASPTVTIEPEE